MENDTEYSKELGKIQKNEKWIETLKKEESLLRQTLSSLETLLIKNDDLIITYQAKLKVNLEKQDLVRNSVGTNSDSGLKANSEFGFTRTPIPELGERY